MRKYRKNLGFITVGEYVLFISNRFHYRECPSSSNQLNICTNRQLKCLSTVKLVEIATYDIHRGLSSPKLLSIIIPALEIVEWAITLEEEWRGGSAKSI